MSKLTKLAQSYIRSNVKSRRLSAKTSDIKLFLKNLELVVHGIRSAFSPERIILHDEVLVGLLQEVVPRIKPAENTSRICVLRLNDHVFVVNAQRCQCFLDSLVEMRNPLHPVFINISQKNTAPIVMTLEQIDCNVKSACIEISKSLKLQERSHEFNTISVSLNDEVNLCTVFGLILGYPAVYYFDDIDQSSSCLNMVPIVVLKVCINETGEQLFSFSYPQSLTPEVTSVVSDWKHPYIAINSICVKEDVALLTSVVF